jgi:hypothetical protein
VKTTAGNTDDVDWTSLSRKHAIETDRKRRVVTIFGGKLTDCLNVGEEVAKEVESLGVPLEKDLHNWYGEPAKATRDEFYRQARLMKLDSLRTKLGENALPAVAVVGTLPTEMRVILRIAGGSFHIVLLDQLQPFVKPLGVVLPRVHSMPAPQ